MASVGGAVCCGCGVDGLSVCLEGVHGVGVVFDFCAGGCGCGGPVAVDEGVDVFAVLLADSGLSGFADFEVCVGEVDVGGVFGDDPAFAVVVVGLFGLDAVAAFVEVPVDSDWGAGGDVHVSILQYGAGLSMVNKGKISLSFVLTSRHGSCKVMYMTPQLSELHPYTIETFRVIDIRNDIVHLQFRWNESLTVNIFRWQADTYNGDGFVESDIFTCSETPTFENVVEDCKQYFIDYMDYMGEMIS